MVRIGRKYAYLPETGSDAILRAACMCAPHPPSVDRDSRGARRGFVTAPPIHRRTNCLPKNQAEKAGSQGFSKLGSRDITSPKRPGLILTVSVTSVYSLPGLRQTWEMESGGICPTPTP